MRTVLLVVAAVLFIIHAPTSADKAAQSLNEASAEDRSAGIKTRLYGYTSFSEFPPDGQSFVYWLRRFGSRNDCLAEGETYIIDWQALGSNHAIAICLFRVFSELPSRAAMESAMTSNGLDWLHQKNGFETTVTCTTQRMPCGAAVGHMTNLIIIRPYGFSATITTHNGRVADVRVGALFL